MKYLILFIVIANTAYGQSGYKISNRTATTRSTVTFALPDFRGTASSTSGTVSATTPRYADDPVAAYTENPLAEIKEYTPRDIGYAEPTYTFPVTADIAPAVATDTAVLGATTTTKSSWTRYSPTIDYAAPLEADMYSGATLFSGVTDTWSSATPETWSSGTIDYTTPVRTDTSTTTTTTSTTTTTASVSTSPYTTTTFVEPTPAPADITPTVQDPVFVEPTRTEIVPVEQAPVSTTPVTEPVIRVR